MKGEKDNMKVANVQSSQIKRIVWENDVMIVTFNTGAVYAYSDAPYAVYTELVEAESVGHQFNESIRDQFEYQKLTD